MDTEHMPSRKKSEELDKALAAAHLRRLARGLEKGVLDLDGRERSLAGTPRFKLKEKIKEELLEIEFSLKIPLRDPESGPTKNKGAGTVHRLADAPKPQESSLSGHPSAKATKKELARIWKEAVRAAKNGETLGPAKTKRLLELCETYRGYVDKEWAEEWGQCSAEVERFLTLLSSGDISAALERADEVNRLTKSCHQKFK